MFFFLTLVAVERGLTDAERKQIKDIILRNPLDDGLDDLARAQVDALVGELVALPKGTPQENKILQNRLRDAWKSFGNEDLGLRKLCVNFFCLSFLTGIDTSSVNTQNTSLFLITCSMLL